MKLATFTEHGRTRIGEVVGDRIHGTTESEPMQYMIRRGVLPNHWSESRPLSAVRLEAPIRPGKIVAIGKNYAEHAKETGGSVPTAPIIFAKFSSSIIATGDAITWSKSITNQVDWEGELAVVIGHRARNVSEADALKHVFGYTVAHDVSARDLQLRTDSQWTRGKSLDTFCPLGPWIVTADEVPDPQNLNISTKVNGKVMQKSNTSNMIFSIPYLIHYCSQMFTLEPGDLILTGTPEGVGEGMKPPQYLNHGDVVEIEVESVGSLTNPCVMTD
jgi:2-keto-4-pentenoate hydratase/2-oxohepta-3-ene-1,7-dioic acid hydratase in catechol pathway